MIYDSQHSRRMTRSGVLDSLGALSSCLSSLAEEGDLALNLVYRRESRRILLSNGFVNLTA